MPKNQNHWVFPVCFQRDDLSDNLRAVYEEVKNRKDIKKIILTRGKPIDIDGINVVKAPLNSKEGLKLLIKSGVVFIKHYCSHNVGYDLNYSKRLVIDLWHGIPIKTIEMATKKATNKHRRDHLCKEHKNYSAVISSSLIDKAIMTSAMHPVTYNEVWLTGLPRIDFITKPFDQLPQDLKNEYAQIEKLKGDKKLVFYAPTFRESKEGCYKFSKDQIEKLKKVLESNNAVLGIREHIINSTNSFSEELSSLNPINLNSFVNIEMIYRLSDILITDYSSCFIDFMSTNKPVVNFSYDYEEYLNNERGFFYELDMIFPDTINKTFNEMLASLEQSFKGDYDKKHYEYCKRTFLKFDDYNNSKRVVDLVEKEISDKP